MMEALREKSLEDGPSVAEIVRRAVGAYLTGITMPLEIPENDGEGLDLKYLTEAPAGPWQEAIERAGTFRLNQKIADEFGARPSDVVVRVVGQSMTGAGVPDLALLVMRPLVNDRPPGNKQITLVQLVRDEHVYESTIKRWVSQTELLDGDDKPIKLPAKTERVMPVAVAIGIISAL
jgi:SOS-response transcriptional repressor LexA